MIQLLLLLTTGDKLMHVNFNILCWDDIRVGVKIKDASL